MERSIVKINKGDLVEVTIKGEVTWVGHEDSLEIDETHVVYQTDNTDIKVVERPVIWSDGDVVQSTLNIGNIAPTTWSRESSNWYAGGLNKTTWRSDQTINAWLKTEKVVVLKQKVQ